MKITVEQTDWRERAFAAEQRVRALEQALRAEMVRAYAAEDRLACASVARKGTTRIERAERDALVGRLCLLHPVAQVARLTKLTRQRVYQILTEAKRPRRVDKLYTPKQGKTQPLDSA